MVQDDSSYDIAPPDLFGPNFAKKSKDFVDQVKALRLSLPAKTSQDNLSKKFEEANPRGGQGPTVPSITNSEVAEVDQPGPTPSRYDSRQLCLFKRNKFKQYSIERQGVYTPVNYRVAHKLGQRISGSSLR